MSDVTRILSKIESGDQQASDELLPLRTLPFGSIPTISSSSMSQIAELSPGALGHPHRALSIP